MSSVLDEIGDHDLSRRDIARLRNALAETEEQLAFSTAERDRLAQRVQDLLKAMVRVTNDTPFASEATDALAQRGTLVAEVGSLKARVAELCLERDRARREADEADAQLADLRAWADDRWNDEVKHRPPENIYRRTLDATWGQVQRKTSSAVEHMVAFRKELDR